MMRRRKRTTAGLVRATYEDDDGRKWAVLVPPGREADAEQGIVVGPPDLSGDWMPHAIMVRLHNELFARGILILADARREPGAIFAALQAAYRVDAATVLNRYAAAEQEGSESE